MQPIQYLYYHTSDNATTAFPAKQDGNSVCLFRINFFFQYADIRQVPIRAVIIQAVADDEGVGNFKAVVIDVDVDLPARRLAQQGSQLDRISAAVFQIGHEIAQRNARIDDILDDEDILSGDVVVHVLANRNRAGRRGRRA